MHLEHALQNAEVLVVQVVVDVVEGQQSRVLQNVPEQVQHVKLQLERRKDAAQEFQEQVRHEHFEVDKEAPLETLHQLEHEHGGPLKLNWEHLELVLVHRHPIFDQWRQKVLLDF